MAADRDLSSQRHAEKHAFFADDAGNIFLFAKNGGE